MTVTCPTINVTAPPAGLPNITATTITPSVTSCQELCSLTVDVTWTNNGTASGIFIPGIQVGTEPPSMLVEETLGAGMSVTKTFNITGLTTGTYTICPIPN